jgi:hypothetical protein
MLPTSGTYNTQSIEIELLIREAYERIGILGEFVESQKLDSARRSIDFLLLEWMNKSVNLWTLEKAFISLVQGKTQYVLDSTVSDIIQLNNRLSTRQLNGTPAASEGQAANAFDSDITTSCIQNGANGNISYDYGDENSQIITFIGIQSSITAAYQIVVEISQDTVNWVPLFEIPNQNFIITNINWFEVPLPQSARSYRIRAKGGTTLNIQEIYFNNNTEDISVSNISRDEYFAIPNKLTQGSPNSYYLDRQIQPILNIWPAPSNLYNCLVYSYKKMIQDSGSYTNSLQIPSRFYPALIWGLSSMLALKYKPELSEMLEAKYERSFELAAVEDSENIPTRIYPNYYITNGY